MLVSNQKITRGRGLGLSWPWVMAAVADHAGRVLPAEPEPVQVLGIDETYRGGGGAGSRAPRRAGGSRSATGGTSGSLTSALVKGCSGRSSGTGSPNVVRNRAVLTSTKISASSSASTSSSSP